ncbi:hypothetical protein QJS66_22875 [Kocuria rhizophila]|nr:hypothetical protein QJS66_22875 [Kocuria rhizophila]
MMNPDSGEIVARGRMTRLVEVGAGFRRISQGRGDAYLTARSSEWPGEWSGDLRRHGGVLGNHDVIDAEVKF